MSRWIATNLDAETSTRAQHWHEFQADDRAGAATALAAYLQGAVGGRALSDWAATIVKHGKLTFVLALAHDGDLAVDPLTATLVTLRYEQHPRVVIA